MLKHHQSVDFIKVIAIIARLRMKTSKNRPMKAPFLSLLAFAASGFACQDSLLVPEEKTALSSQKVLPLIDCEENKQDILKIQTSEDAILYDQILLKDSIYILNITLEEVRDLGLSDSLFHKFTNMVHILNAK